jgi:putative Holliday junction resolvase
MRPKEARKPEGLFGLTPFRLRFYTPPTPRNILPKTINPEPSLGPNPADVPKGRLLALDLGGKRVGVAISDELQITVRPLTPLRRTNWKQLLRDVSDALNRLDAQALVIGLPLRLDGSEGEAALEARRLARNFQLSLQVPVYLHDEKLTTRAADESLRDEGLDDSTRRERLDSTAAAIILSDFIAGLERVNAHEQNSAEI